MVSIIIPTLDEATVIGRTLDRLAESSGEFEVLVADGQSEDETLQVVRGRISKFPHRLRIVSCPRQRALQLNLAAEQAAGEIILFLHADTEVPGNAISKLEQVMRRNSAPGGNFQIEFSGHSPITHLFTWIYRIRRPLGIYYGDSGIFVRRETFARMGGFKPIPIMDDYEFVRRMERQGKTVCVQAPLLVSDRRWRVQGMVKTLASWIWIQLLFSLGIPPQRLASVYRPVRENGVGSSTGQPEQRITGKKARQSRGKVQCEDGAEEPFSK